MNTERLFLSPPHMSGHEESFVQEAFRSNYIAPLGPMVDAFEKDMAAFTGIRHAAALSSGTAAMHLALRGVGVGPGDEVFASSLTFIGSVTPILFLGAVPVFIDSDPTSWNMDVRLLEEELAACQARGKLPAAVVPTDLYGQCCDYAGIFEVCGRYGVPVVVDAAEAMGALYYSKRKSVSSMQYAVRSKSEPVGSKQYEVGRNEEEENSRQHVEQGDWVHAGKGADAAVFSFNGNKIITTSGGGMLVSDDRELIEKARFLSQQARELFPHYEHEEIGYNYRMSNVLAAIGRGQLKVLQERVDKRREIFEYYRQGLVDLPGISFMPEPQWSRSNRWLSVMLVKPELFGADRELIRLALEEENIEARPVWKPMHLQPVFDPTILRAGKGPNGRERYPCRVVGGSVAEGLFDQGLCLPSGTAMTHADQDRVIEVIRSCWRSR